MNDVRNFDMPDTYQLCQVLVRFQTYRPVSNDLKQVFDYVSEILPNLFYGEVALRIEWDGTIIEDQTEPGSNLIDSFGLMSSDGKTGRIYLYTFRASGEVDLKNWHVVFQILSGAISGMINAAVNLQLSHENKERRKEIKGIERSIDLLQQVVNLDESLGEICKILPDSFQYPDHTMVRIRYGRKVFTSDNFKETPWVINQHFQTEDGKTGSVEVFYNSEFPDAAEGPFLKEERALLINLANLIAGNAAKNLFKQLKIKNKERIKELKAINKITRLISENKPLDETLQEICDILPRSWQYPQSTVSRIHFEGRFYTSEHFVETQWRQTEQFVTIDNNKGFVEVCYTRSFPKAYEGPFLREERDLIINVAGLIRSYLNNYKGREVYRKSAFNTKAVSNRLSVYKESRIKDKNPLQQFFSRKTIEKYIYLDMMKYKVKEILFVATLYDAFMLEADDSFFERFLGEVYQYSLFSLPRITGVTTEGEALEMLKSAPFDIVILMVGMDKESPLRLSGKIKEFRPDIPVFLLLNQFSNVQYFREILPSLPAIDKLFVWNGDAQIFFAIVKSTEDYANVDDDTKVGLVRVILLVEDSPEYYSKYLPILYSIVFGQVQEIMPEVEKNELDKISKMRSRPKIIHARNYEDATHYFNIYKDFLLCVICDMEFDRNGHPDHRAGVRFINYLKSHIFSLPIILQSADPANETVASKLNVTFFHKTSETLLRDLRAFLYQYLGFGDFVFRDKSGNAIATAKTLNEFITLLSEVPEESYYLHATENQFSIWLMARGEIKLAKTLNPIHVSSFESVEASRQYFIKCLKDHEENRQKGKILDFDASTPLNDRNILSLSGGSLGGKGRGISFISALINNFDFGELAEKLNVRIPVTLIIGTDEFEGFLRRNHLHDTAIHEDMPYEELQERFVSGRLSKKLRDKLHVFSEKVNFPVAIRSSSLSEDSYMQPFSGVFDTYALPDAEDKKVFYERLLVAIKLVFASVFSEKARGYFKAINRKVEEERMAIVIQELIGNRYDQFFYPHISGVAQSFNFYPVGHMTPEEGYSLAAIGLGRYVVEGWPAYRFSPVHPEIEIYTPKDLVKNAQVKFFALDYSKESLDFLSGGEEASLTMLDIAEAERHGNLRHCASVYDADNDRLEVDFDLRGPRVINFANILQYNYFPLAQTIRIVLETIRESLGTPVEIEFAVDLNRTRNNLPSFYLLQIKPLVSQQISIDVDIEDYNADALMLSSNSSVGNGIIDDVADVIFVKNEVFDKLKTLEMSEEIDRLNDAMFKNERKYLLIGPGRWGSRDPFLGIPVVWSQISMARMIVEVSLSDYPLDASMGSHFFHNLTSMQIGYCSVLDNNPGDFLDWEKMNNLEIIAETTHFKHVRAAKPMKILMNGKKKKSIILIE